MDVLLVEDDDLVRLSLGIALDDAGLRVAAVADAGRALELAETDGAPAVLVADVVLGRGMDGPALVAAARRRWPGLGVVLMTGADVVAPALGPNDLFLRKPFDLTALVRLVAQLAAGRTAADRTPGRTPEALALLH